MRLSNSANAALYKWRGAATDGARAAVAFALPQRCALCACAAGDACLWGASFPLALAAIATERQDPGRMVGAVYAANTVGAIAGALVFSTVLIPALGTQNAQRVMMAVALVAAGLALFPLLRGMRSGLA